MPRMLPLTVVTIAALAWHGVGAAADESADKADEEARQLCEQVRKLGVAKDIDNLMKVVEVPFYFHAEKETEVLRERDVVKAKFQQFFASSPKEARFEMTRLLPYEKLLEEFKDKLTDEDRKAMDTVLKKGDRILFIEVTSEGKRLDSIAWLVGWRDGKARIVGVRD